MKNYFTGKATLCVDYLFKLYQASTWASALGTNNPQQAPPPSTDGSLRMVPFLKIPVHTVTGSPQAQGRLSSTW